ncbi:MAG: hypothetical protein LUD76_00450 [Alistipes sp.]|nr:hypothetical protein [Alistipes sp.]
MRKLTILALVVTLCSCLGPQKPAEQHPVAEDTLQREKEFSDSLLSEVFASLTEITDNLNTIKIRENLITTSYNSGEIQVEPTAVIRADIAAIDELLAENRRALDRLRHNADQLKKANRQVESLERLLSAFADQIAAKDHEINALKEELRIKTEQVETLTSGLEEETRLRGELETELESTTGMLNTAYYIVGSAKELKRKGITGKSGFIGRTTVVNDNHELDDFTAIDLRTFDELILGRKNVEVVTSHPEGSYVFVMGERGVYQSLVITDKARFWATSKILVVSYK